MGEELLQVVDAREAVWKSWARDTYSFGVLAGTAWLCNTQMPPSGWINALLVFLWFFWMISRARRHITHMTAEQARAWLDENYPPDMTEAKHG